MTAKGKSLWSFAIPSQRPERNLAFTLLEILPPEASAPAASADAASDSLAKLSAVR